MNSERSRNGMTLVEVLVVMAIIGLLLALILPAVQRVRDAGYRVTCLNNLKQIGLALHGYHDAHRVLPPGCTGPDGQFPHMGWCARLLPFIEQHALWQEAVTAFAEDDWFLEPPHLKVRTTILPVFCCPADERVFAPKPSGVRVAFTSYLGVEGVNQKSLDGVLYLNSRVRLTDLSDGAAQTVMVGERPPEANLVLGWWYAGWGQAQDGSAEMILSARELSVHSIFQECHGDSNRYRAGRISNTCDALHFWSLHFGGAHFLFCDGSARILSYDADAILPALATRAGGEPVRLPE